METRKPCSVTLVTCRKSRLPHLLGSDDDSTIYLAGIPNRINLNESILFIIEKEDIEGKFGYEIAEYFQNLKELIVEATEDKNLLITVFGPKECLIELRKYLDIPFPFPIQYNFFDNTKQKNEDSSDYCLVIVGTEIGYYPYDPVMLCIDNPFGKSFEPRLN